MIDKIVDILVMNNQNRQGSCLLRVHFGKRPRALSKQRFIKEQDTKGHSVWKTCQCIALLSGQKRADPGRIGEYPAAKQLKRSHWSQAFKVVFMDPLKSSTTVHSFWAPAKWALLSSFLTIKFPFKSYLSSVTHTQVTFFLVFTVFLLIPPTNLQTTHISRSTLYSSAHGSFTSLRINYVSNSW